MADYQRCRYSTSAVYNIALALCYKRTPGLAVVTYMHQRIVAE